MFFVFVIKSNQPSMTVRNTAYGYNNDNEQVNSVTVPVNSAYTEINDGMVYYSNEFKLYA